MKDDLGTRIKENYENRTRIYLPRRSYTIIRIDGKSFHNYTKGLKRPFDEDLVVDMDTTAAYLCKNIPGAKLAFVQSDEISILVTDFDDISTQAWFDNNLQKMCSVSASMATSKFNQLRLQGNFKGYSDGRKGISDFFDAEFLKNNIFKLAEFDSRVFQIPQKTEVMNYFVWRQQDTVRNSISSVAQSLYSHKELNGVKTDQMQEMIFQKGINWNDFEPKLKRGRIIVKEQYLKEETTRSRWVSNAPPTFTQDRGFLFDLIPNNE